MHPVNMSSAKSKLSRLVDAIEQGDAREIIITRNGRPAAKLVLLDAHAPENKIGVAKGRFVVPESIDGSNEEVAGQLLSAAP